jgi:hypothetical protein
VGKYMFAWVFVVIAYIVLPAAIVWGWVRWLRRAQPHTLLSALSLVALGLGSASALLAFSSIIYAHVIGGFPFYDPRLLRIYRWGTLLSLSGLVCGIIGIWRPGPLRWLAPACAVGTFLYWIAMASTE